VSPDRAKHQMTVQRRTVPIKKVRFASIYKEPLCGTLNRPPRRCAAPLLTKEGTRLGLNHSYYNQHRAKRRPDAGLQFPNEFILDSSAFLRRGFSHAFT
jgi:hypothetical protein